MSKMTKEQLEILRNLPLDLKIKKTEQRIREFYDYFEGAEQGDIVNFAFPRSKNRRGRVGRKIANTLDHHTEQYVIEYLGRNPKPNAIEFTMDGEQFYTCIRKLTGIECMRLQGLDYNNAKLLSEIHSDFVLYKQAGNSVTIGIIYEIGRHMT